MHIEHQEKYTLLADIGPIMPNISAIKETMQSLEKKHVVVLFSENETVSKKDLLIFLKIAKQKKENGTSFVVVFTAIDVDDFSEDLNIVPTLQEAEDIIEMENIERELGF